MFFQKRLMAVGLTCVLLVAAGCAGIPADRGFDGVRQHLHTRGVPLPDAPSAEQAATLQAQLDEWLSQPLNAEAAVRIALVRNPGLQNQYAALGIAQADLYDAARLANPTFSVSVLGSSAPDDRPEITLGLAQNFANLLLLRPRTRIATAEVERTQLLAAQAVLRLAADVETAYYRYIGARQIAQMRQLAARAADISAAFADRFYQAGNINRLQLQTENAAASEARIAASLAAAQAEIARTELNRIMGLKAADANWQALIELPLPVSEEDDRQRLLELAGSQRMDLLAARRQVTIFEDALGLARSYRYLGSFELGVEYEQETESSHLLGPTLALQLPIFNQGDGSVLRARARLEHSRADARQLDIDISNAVALASKKVTVMREVIQRYRSELIPQREEVVERMQELQLFMIIGQFELLQAKQQVFDAYQGYIESVRDYWLARVELAREVGAKLPSDASRSESTLDVEQLTTPPAGSQHHHHGHSPAPDAPPTKAEPAHEHGEHS